MPKTNKSSKNSGNAEKSSRIDRRIRRTKRLIKEAFIELILEKGYNEVSVQEIIDKADVGRTSFYTYFRSKEDLLLQILDEMGQIFAPGPDLLEKTIGNEPVDFSLMLFRHLDENRRLARALIGNRNIPVVRDYVQGLLLRYYRDHFKAEKRSTKNSFQTEGAAYFASGALLSMILWWLSMEKPAAPEAMNELYRGLGAWDHFMKKALS